MLDSPDKISLNLRAFDSTVLVREPFSYVVVKDILTKNVAEKLCATFPSRGFYRSVREEGSDKTYNVANNILLGLGEHINDRLLDLSDPWQMLLLNLTSAAYIHAVSELLKINLQSCYLEITFKAYGQGDYISAHTDRSWVSATHLIFLNIHWQPEWGGILNFLNDKKEAFLSLMPTFEQSVAFVRADNSWHEVTPVAHLSEKRLAIQVAFWNTLDRYILPGRMTTSL